MLKNTNLYYKIVLSKNMQLRVNLIAYFLFIYLVVIDYIKAVIFDVTKIIESTIEKRVLDRVMRDYILIYKLDRTSDRENNQK